MKSAKVQIINKAGLHARAASKLAALAARFGSDITIGADEDGMVDCKSVLSLMMLEAVSGTELHIKADGPDEEEALKALLELIAARFDESE